MIIQNFNLSKEKRISLFDRFITITSFLYPILAIPQLIKVFDGDKAGVSLASWAGYTLFSFIFLIYGIVHKIKPMIIANGLCLVVNGLVVVGIVINLYQQR